MSTIAKNQKTSGENKKDTTRPSKNWSLGKEIHIKYGQVCLTVSSLPGSCLELNWATDCSLFGGVEPEYIALYDVDIKNINEESVPLVKIKASDYPHGYYKTKIKFKLHRLPGNWEYDKYLTGLNPGPHCFPYWIVSVAGDKIIDANCLKIQPTWMNDNRSFLGAQCIGKLFIPGTHNSGSYTGTTFCLKDYVLTQHHSVWTQLVFGIRYFDFRIGYYKNQGFFINHDIVKIMRVELVFQQIRKFIRHAPKEVVIIDFHRFPYPRPFNQSLHKKFVELLYNELGDLAFPFCQHYEGGPTLNQIWAQNKNLIICYADYAVSSEHIWLWPPLKQYWADTKDLHSLKNFLDKAIKGHKMSCNPMYALMAEFTPKPVDLVLRKNNLRQLANKVNRHLTKWFRSDWALHTSIVASDFFLGNDIINIAISTNISR